MKNIRVITPVIATEVVTVMDKVARSFSIRGCVEVDHTFIDTGTASIENYIDDALVTPGIINAAIEAEQSGIDGLVINCMCDPGVHAVREAVSIPVSGTAEIAMHAACILGHAFGFIDVLESSRTMVMDQVARYGVRDRFGSFRAINIPVLEIESRKQETMERLAEEAVKLVRDDHVDIIILGCGSLYGCDVLMKSKINELLGTNRCPVPIIDPLPLAINAMIAIVHSGLAHSKQAYPLPTNKKKIKGYNLPIAAYEY